MKTLQLLAIAAAALLAAATPASAQEAFTTSDVNLRAGPGTRYPVVRLIPEDAMVYIHGCLPDWDWCDVSWRRSRGWVFSDALAALYGNRRIGFDEWRDNADIPSVSFGFGYWDRYYRDRPWYGHWERWGDRNDRRWRNRHRDSDGGDWNDQQDGSGSNWTRNRDNTGSNWNRNRDNTGNNWNRNRRNSESDAPPCTLDDPSCNDETNQTRRRRSQQMPDVEEQQQPQ